MTSFTRRYASGDHDGVWADLRRLGTVPDAPDEDCREVAFATMRRVAAHVDRLAERLTGLGLVPVMPVREPVTAEDLRELDALRAETGPVPPALDACLRQVGGAWFAGDCAALNECYATGNQYSAAPVLPDPLVLPTARYLRESWNAHRDAAEDGEEDFFFDFAPDELHKANISGATHDIDMSAYVADPVLHGVAGRPGITLVAYLRLSIAWAGMPGWSFAAHHTPPRSPDPPTHTPRLLTHPGEARSYAVPKHRLQHSTGTALHHDHATPQRQRAPPFPVGPFDVLPGESNGGGYEIRTREGLPPTRFPNVRTGVRRGSWAS
ncbi:hypothetical protein [Streptomyces sp. SPB074]|uniref:hypothetical protein n=1 Tax=Streptomyces sp. (strain SPB074) TaxID=465543 RepID=UPI00017F13C7|nr:hypothetical protein [Streptomyces sp. SPB074]EDY42924.1 conserved hypothetical protein [Streptomyces sp. SPB074]